MALYLFSALFSELGETTDPRDLTEMERIGLHAKRAQIFLKERFYLRCAMNKMQGRALETPLPDVKRLEHGKPYFEGNEAYFNITHSGGSILILFSDKEPVGLDAEILRLRRNLPSLAKKVLSAEEHEKFERLAMSDEAAGLPADSLERQSLHYFLLHWTHRECLLKHSGIGLAGLSGIDRENQVYLSPLNSAGTLKSFKLADICPEQGWFTIFPTDGEHLKAFACSTDGHGKMLFEERELQPLCTYQVEQRA